MTRWAAARDVGGPLKWSDPNGRGSDERDQKGQGALGGLAVSASRTPWTSRENESREVVMHMGYYGILIIWHLHDESVTHNIIIIHGAGEAVTSAGAEHSRGY